MRSLHLELKMIPPKSTAQQAKVAVLRGQVRKYDPKTLKAAKLSLLTHLLMALPKNWTTLFGPLRVAVEWRFPHLASAPKKTASLIKAAHPRRPDIDNIAKGFFDACTQAGIWADDSQIYSLQFAKYYSSNPGITITVEED